MSKPILCVEDDPAIRECFFEFFTKEGFDITVAADGEEGLKVLEEFSDFCLVTTAQNMPGMDGFEFADTVIKTYKIPVVMITGFSDGGQAAEKAKKIGIDKIYLKPFPIEKMTEMLRRYTGQGVKVE